jgi:myosin V
MLTSSSYYMLMHSSQWAQGGADIKAFCATILKQTLTDPDKYQIGLTKVFLRAGMLAYLESRRLDRLNTLATIVQKNFKRAKERNRYLRLRKSAIKIQTWWRGVMAKQLVLSIKKDVAARKLQATARRFVQRRKFLEVHNSVIKLQSRKF